MSTSSTARMEAIMSAMRQSTARTGCDGLCFLVRGQSTRRRLSLMGLEGRGSGSGASSGAARAASSSWRRRVPSLSVMNSRLPKWKVEEGGNGGGAHDPSRGTAGNSKVPKRIVSLWLAVGAAVEADETIDRRSAPHGRRQSVATENGDYQTT